MRRPTRLRTILQASLAGVALGFLLVTGLPPQSYKKDLQVEYLTAWALRDGIDVFTPLDQLSSRYFPTGTDNFPHPSPHPPFLALLSVPLTLLPFPVIAFAWLVFNVVLLVIVGRWLGLSIPSTLALAAWPPLWWLLFIGQFELVILAVAMLGWREAAAGRDWRAGFWLGLATVVKLYPALFFLSYVVRRRSRVLLAGGAVVLLSQAGNLAVVGWSGLGRYYGQILPAVSERYAQMGLNCSPYGALLRVFGGSSDVVPLIDAPQVVLPAAITLSLVALLAFIRLPPRAAPLAALVALPSTWFYYAVLTLPQIVNLLRFCHWRRTVLAATAAASIGLPVVNLLLFPILGFMQWRGDLAPPLAGLLMAMQPLGFLALLILSLCATDRPTGGSAVAVGAQRAA